MRRRRGRIGLFHFGAVRRGRFLAEILPHHHGLVRIERPAAAHPERDRRGVDDVAPGIGAQRELVAALLARWPACCRSGRPPPDRARRWSAVRVPSARWRTCRTASNTAPASCGWSGWRRCADVSFAYLWARLNLGSAIVMMIRMIAITISNSIREKPRRRRCRFIIRSLPSYFTTSPAARNVQTDLRW